MAARPGPDAHDRILLLAPTRKDETTTTALLTGAAFAVHACASLDDVISELRAGACAIVLAEESLAHGGAEQLRHVLQGQPRWSDLPLLVLTRPGASSVVSSHAAETLGNVTLLERPLRLATFLSAVRTAARARQRQYEICRFLQERAAAEESLRRADERKDEFLATLGHELRNPLAPLLSGVHLMRLLIPEHERVLRVAATMERQIKHLVRLVDDLLEVSRITRGLVEVRRDPVDLLAVLNEAIETSRPALERGRHHLTIHVPGSPVPVAGDSVRLTQVFANLLTNAAKYTNEGGHIQVTATCDGAFVSVSVKDDGIGLSRMHLDSVFDMFMQVDRSSRRAQGGLGIGLTLVRSLVRLHEGRVEARSQGPGTGSEFVVTLPLQGHRPAVPTPVPPPRSLPNRRVLVVDDNEDAATMLAALLEGLGATVAVASSGPSALDQAEAFAPDAVVLDIGMPDMDGHELARRLRALPIGADMLLVALTGWGQHDDRERSRAAGFDEHVAKPIDASMLDRLLAHRRAV